MDKRTFITGAVAALLSASFGDAARAQQNPRWRDLFHLDIKDSKLGAIATRFLDALQAGRAGNAGILGRAGRLRESYRAAGLIPQMENAGFMRGGKFIITSHGKAYDESTHGGTYTIGMERRGFHPGKIVLGTQHLKGALYYDSRGRAHPVTVEAALTHELAHLVHGPAIGASSENLPIQTENNFLRAAGLPRRARERTSYRRRGFYVSAYDKSAALLPFLEP